VVQWIVVVRDAERRSLLSYFGLGRGVILLGIRNQTYRRRRRSENPWQDHWSHGTSHSRKSPASSLDLISDTVTKKTRKSVGLLAILGAKPAYIREFVWKLVVCSTTCRFKNEVWLVHCTDSGGCDIEYWRVVEMAKI